MWTRRLFLKAGGIALFTLDAGPRFLARTAFAAQPGRRKVLVTLFQRGAMDGRLPRRLLRAGRQTPGSEERSSALSGMDGRAGGAAERVSPHPGHDSRR